MPSITELKEQIMSFGRTYTEIQTLHDAADALIANVQAETVARCVEAARGLEYRWTDGEHYVSRIDVLHAIRAAGETTPNTEV